jgi:DNA repair protein RadC
VRGEVESLTAHSVRNDEYAILAPMEPYSLSKNDLLFDGRSTKVESADRPYVLRIRDLPAECKPREKLLKHGAAALTIHELIAIVFNTGTKKEDVMSMASRVIREYGPRALANHNDPRKIAANLDIPLIKALQLTACSELGRRFYGGERNGKPVTIRNARDAFNYLHDMQSLTKEHFRGIYLNTHHRIVHDEVISIGTLDANLVHPREVFKPALEHGAIAVILAHNHPSGITTPSEADVEITQQLIEAGKIMGIRVIDHLILGANKFTCVHANY